MAQPDQTDLHELVGAYALDALDADEAREFEAHLDDCPRCRAELRDHRDTATYLAHVGAPAPDGVWERIASQLDETPPDMARVLPMLRPRAAQRWVWAAAAAAVIGLAAGALAQHQVAGSNTPSLQALAARAVRAPGAQRARLITADGSVAGDAVVTADGQGYLQHLALRTLDGEHAYQLWGVTALGQPVSLGILGGHPTTASFSARLAIAKLAITVEQAQGAAAPTVSPVVSGALHRA